MCPFYFDIASFMRELELPYHGESVGLATLRAIEHLMRPRRETVSPQERAGLMVKQKNLCAKCGACLLSASAEVDHEPRVCESLEQELQMLCVSCHRTKTSEEQSRGNAFNIRSRFSRHAVTCFRDQIPTLPLVLHLGGSPGKGSDATWSVDLIKCRAECWKYSSAP